MPQATGCATTLPLQGRGWGAATPGAWPRWRKSLRGALAEAARREGITSSEFLRREVRVLLKRKSIEIPTTAKFGPWVE